MPARTKIRCGRDSASLKRCVPQVGQKRRCILLPLSATLWKSRVSPRTEISADGKQTDTAAFPVAIYWQRRHQQRRAVRGSAFVSYRTALQRHPPVITEAPPQKQREYGMKLAARPSQRAYARLSRYGVNVPIITQNCLERPPNFRKDCMNSREVTRPEGHHKGLLSYTNPPP